MTTTKQSNIRDVAITTGTTGLIFLATLVGGIVLSRVLGPTGKGQLAQLAVWASFTVDLLLFGVPGATTYSVARWPEHRLRLLLTIGRRLVIQALVGVTIFSILTATGDAASDLPVVAIIAYAAWILAATAVELTTGYLQGRADFLRLNWVRLISQASPVVLLMVVAGLGGLSVSAGAVIYALSVAAAASLGLMWTRRDAYRTQSDKPMYRIELDEVLKTSSSFAKREYASTLATKSNRSVDLLVVSLLPVAASDIGIYSVASSSAGALIFVGGSIGMVAFSRSAQGGRKRSVLRALILWAAVLTSAAAAVLYLAAPTLIPLVYGEEFSDSVPLVRILVFGAAAVSVGQVLAGILKGRGKPGSVAIAEAVGAAATVLGILVLGTDNIEYVAYSAIAGFGLTVAIEASLLVAGGPIGEPRDR